MAHAERYKLIEIEAVMRLLRSIRDLVVSTSRDPRHSSQTAIVISDLLDASAAVAKATQNRLVVDVPSDIKDTLSQIQKETKEMQKLLLQLQGMVMKLEAQRNPFTEHSATSRPAHRYPASEQAREREDNFQTLFEMMQDLSINKEKTRPPDDPRFQVYFTK